jgi:4-nitrophenyl phosphatase
VLDLDGVVWLGDTPIPGASAACGRLVAAGIEPVYVTNMSRLTVVEQEEKLARHGIDATGRVVTSALAVATLCSPGERVLVVGGRGVVEALEARDVELVDALPADTVVVGMEPAAFRYDLLKRATLALREGARFLATNTDPTYPTPEGLVPGSGAYVAALETASGRKATVAGKPNRAIADLVIDMVGPEGVVVGDRAETDGEFARALGYDFGLVLSGTTTESDLPVEPEPRWTADSLDDLVAAFGM